MVYLYFDACHRSPIQKLPVELLSHIFSFVQHSTGDDEPHPDIETIKVPLVLSSVNHHWRNVARKTAFLWTSICVTINLLDYSAKDGCPSPTTTLNTSHLVTYLALSRNQPLDIVIDARDEGYNFSEAEISTQYPSNYTPPFSSTHMIIAISHLLLHISRWRSLSILTDTWIPMYTALQEIQSHITTIGAPRLESLTLMRCNEYVSAVPVFQPQEMRDPKFLNLSNTTTPLPNLLPRLRNLTLFGVHVDWTSLSSILTQSNHGLDSLELYSHCMDVRPTRSEFHQLLSQCPHLSKLVVNASGPRYPDDNANPTTPEEITCVALPLLRELTVGYHSAPEGKAILDAIDATRVESFTLEDASLPGHVGDLNAGSLLTYLATGDFPSQEVQTLHVAPSGREKDYMSVSSPASPTTIFSRNVPYTSALFPLLQEVTLRKVHSCPSTLHAFLTSIPRARRIDFHGTPIDSIKALYPQLTADAGIATVSCACPQLQTLDLHISHADFDKSLTEVGNLARQRFRSGGLRLQNVSIHLDNTNGCTTEKVIFMPDVGTTVTVVSQEEEDEFIDYDMDSDQDPFEVGGAFNDPVFDAQYAAMFNH